MGDTNPSLCINVEPNEALKFSNRLRYKHNVQKYPGGISVNTRFGNVVVDDKGIRNSLTHSMYQAKLEVFLTLKEGIERAAFIGSMPNFNNQDIDNYYYIYKIKYGKDEKIVYCRVQKDVNQNRLYLHDIYTEEDINNKELSSFKTRGREGETPDSSPRRPALAKSIIFDFFGTCQVLYSN